MRKLHTDGEMLRIDDRLGALRELLARTPGVVAAYLFGSYGTPRQTPLSDVDLAFAFRLGDEPDFDQELAFRSDVLAALEEEDVSIVILNNAPSPLQYEILSTGRQIFCSDPTALADLVERILKFHQDFVIDYERFLAEYDTALKARYAHA